MIREVLGFPIYICSIENPEKANKEIQNCIDNTNTRDPSEDWNAECITTSSHGYGCEVEGKLIKFDYIFSELNKHIDIFTKKLGIDSCFTCNVCGDRSCQEPHNDTWINIYNKGHYQDDHFHIIDEDDEDYKGHPPSYFSFTYFAKYDTINDGKFAFVDPSPAPLLYEQWSDKCKFFKREIIPDVKEGDILIFPSHLIHKVNKQMTDGPRITFSGNFYQEK